MIRCSLVPSFVTDRKPFEVPITVFLDGPQTFHVVASVSDASDFLFDHWPGNDSEKWTAAMTICNRAADGTVDREDARIAFLDAVNAAGMRVSAIVTL